MAVKRILDIDVNDASFKRFQAAFNQYNDLLSKQPAAWKKVTDGIDASKASFEQLVAQMVASQGKAKLIAAAHEAATKAVEGASRHWKNLWSTTKNVASNINNITRSLLSWGNVVGVMAGLLGVGGGLFGISRLAQSAASQRTSAFGLGISPAEHSAFTNVYGRLGNAEGMLSSVNAAANDPRQRVPFYQLGYTDKEFTDMDPAQLAALLPERLVKLLGHSGQNLAMDMQSFGIDQITDLGTAKNAIARQNELGGYRQDFEKQTQANTLSEGVWKSWENLKVKFDEAATAFETMVIQHLTPLTGPLGDLSTAFTKMVGALLGSDGFKQVIDDTTAALKWVTDIIAPPKGDVAKSAWSKLLLSGEKLTPEEQKVDLGGFGNFLRGLDQFLNKLTEWQNQFGEFMKKFWGGLDPGPGYRFNPNEITPGFMPTSLTTGGWRTSAQRAAGSGDPNQTFLSQLEQSAGLPGGILDAVWGAEASRSMHPKVSTAGAVGPFQFMEKTWAQYGHGDRNDFHAAAQAASEYLNHLLEVFHGNTREAVAGYNTGEENVKRAIARAGAGGNWENFLYPETQGYLNKVFGGNSGGNVVGLNPSGRQTYAINIFNQAGANITIAQNQVAH